MPWATYDTTSFPHIKVTLNGSIKDDADFNHFTQQWLNLYEYKQDFYMTFDASDVGMVNPKYAFRMSSFIRRLKYMNADYEYLKASNIMYDSFYVKMLLKLIFAMQSPVAPVTLIKKGQENSGEVYNVKQVQRST